MQHLPTVLNIEWSSKNSIQFNEAHPGTHKKYWWVCNLGHEWDASPSNRIRSGSGCPYCAGNKVLPGFNDFATTHPHLTQLWSATNVTQPNEITAGSGKKITLRCVQNHEWDTTPNKLSLMKAATEPCPYCGNRKLLAGFNDVASTYPVLAVEWSGKNPKTANQVLQSYSSILWWTCSYKHEWQSTIARRVNENAGCPTCINRKVLPGYNDVSSTHPQIMHEWSPYNTTSPQTISYGSRTSIMWVCKNGHEWMAALHTRTAQNPSGCPSCSSKSFSSKAENDISLFLQGLGLEIKTHVRNVLPKQELDIFIPAHNIAIEYNGVYWHSEAAGKTRHYHYNKWLAAKKVDIQLIQIWEDDWNRNPELIKTMLAHKLGYSIQTKHYARNTTTSILHTAQAKEFLKKNHVQGFASGSYYLALVSTTTPSHIVSVMVLRKENETLNIVRYATAGHVVGGFSKLLKYATVMYSPQSFLTFADHTVSDGSLYETHGFVADKEIPPDYMYVIKGNRKHKFGYRLKRFRNDPTLLWEQGLTERELAKLNNIPRIWDAGKTRYVLKIEASTPNVF